MRDKDYIRMSIREPRKPRPPAVFYWYLWGLIMAILFGMWLMLVILTFNVEAVDFAPVTYQIEAPAPEPQRYPLTETERALVEQVVAAEAIGEPYLGQVAVAQCLLTSCEKDGIRPHEAVREYKYARSRKEPSADVVQAVAAVFDKGYRAVSKPIVYFYAPARTVSSWHEKQEFVIEIGGHRFFE